MTHSRFLAGACTAALLPFLPLTAAASELSAEVSASLGTWDGSFEKTEAGGRPLHFAEVPLDVSIACPAGAPATSLGYVVEPASGLIAAIPEDGGENEESASGEASAVQGSSQRQRLKLQLKPGAIYRVQAKGNCCGSADGEGQCTDAGEEVSAVTSELEIPPVIEAARVLSGGYFYGGLVAGQSDELTIYDASPEPQGMAGDNRRKFLKFSGLGVSFKTSDYRRESFSISTITPTSAGKMDVKLTIKGKLYSPEGRYLRDYTLESDVFKLPVTSPRCVLDANVQTFITEDSELVCLDEDALSTEPKPSDDSSGGCGSAGGMPLTAALLPVLLAPLSLWKKRRFPG